MTKLQSTAEFGGAAVVPAIGDVIADKYRVDSIVGTGGMGVVLSATHLGLGQRVAIKVLTVPPDDARLDEARERFLREGRSTAALISDHVVRVYDVGTLADGSPFMVMELLRGQDLSRTLQQQGALPIELAVDCVRQAADAISAAHAQGIVHRDLKPSNLFLTQRSDGSPLVKVLDFGISKAMSAELDPITGSLTATRSVLGTPFYMSPEQVRDAKKVDARTDIWSLGLILHELLSASPAFEGTTLPGVCAAIAADPPAALRLKRPEVPVELEAIVLKCLEKDPARRFQSARELGDRLAPWSGRPLASASSLGPLSDQTIRSQPLFEASELHDGSTVSLSSDKGTLASAVFTQSGSRIVAATSGAHESSSLPPTQRASRPTTAPQRHRRLTVGIGLAACALVAALLWLRGGTEAPSAPAAAPSLLPDSRLPASSPSPRAFAVEIESTPAGADVFEGEQKLGRTPLRVTVTESPRTFTVRKAGFLPYTIVQDSSPTDTRVLAELSAEPSATIAPIVPPAASHAPAAVTPSPAHRAPAPRAPAPRPSAGGDIFMQR
jgi:serine/threonine-protein kinase